MKKEYWLVAILGLFIFAYILDAIVNPLSVNLTTPYHYFVSASLTTFPFTTTSIAIKAIAVFIIPLLAISFLDWNKTIKGIIVFVISGLLQLYALQDVVSNTHTVPVEWAISFTLAGMILLIPAIIFVIWGLLQRVSDVGTESEDEIEF